LPAPAPQNISEPAAERPALGVAFTRGAALALKVAEQRINRGPENFTHPKKLIHHEKPFILKT
jgi:hypothetical protein